MRQTPAKGAAWFCRRKLSAWKKCSGQVSLSKSFWHDKQMPPISLDLFIVGCGGKTSQSWPMGIMNCCGTSEGVIILGTSERSTPAARNIWVVFPRTSIKRGWTGATEEWNQEGSPCGSWLRASIFWRFDRWWGWWCWPPSCQFSQRCLAWWMSWRWEGQLIS